MKDVSEKLPEVLTPNESESTMYTRDEQTFGKYLSRPGNFFASWSPDPGPTREYLQAMQER